MKTVKFIGMAFMALFMSVGFAACGDDEESPNPNTPGGSTTKKLVYIRETANYGEITTLEYNSDGWLANIYDLAYPDENNAYVKYEKMGDYTLATLLYADGSEGSRFLYDDLLRRVNDDITCEYDSEGHLIKYGDMIFTWENGNVISYGRAGSPYYTTYTYYMDKENKFPTYADPVIGEVDDYCFLQAHPQLLGVWCKNLVKTVNDDNITYELDADGYPIKYMENGNVEFDFKWE